MEQAIKSIRGENLALPLRNHPSNSCSYGPPSRSPPFVKKFAHEEGSSQGQSHMMSRDGS